MQRVDLVQGAVEEHGSTGVYMIEVARLTPDDAEHFRTHTAQVGPGGILGRHEGRWWQLFCVVHGSGWVSGEDRARRDIAAGEAVLWAPGEDHESAATTA
ncbi:hypothetical protein [uncultured Jatrophihabitans sp.]|uniref:hypothetical protein n=1 Tax=uncultured Jatrophihabitans sp. TaxID=1610747 RepID=UPI0035CA21B2